LDSNNCRFVNNHAELDGGAIFIQITSIYSSSDNCFFENNTVAGRRGGDTGNGGAIYITFYSSYKDS
jgi:predicted outer membrane repeat protein